MLSLTPLSNFQGSLHHCLDTWYNNITVEAVVSRHSQETKKVSILGAEMLMQM